MKHLPSLLKLLIPPVLIAIVVGLTVHLDPNIKVTIGDNNTVYTPTVQCLEGWEMLRPQSADPERGVDAMTCGKRDESGGLTFTAYYNTQGILIVHDIIGNRLVRGVDAEGLYK